MFAEDHIDHRYDQQVSEGSGQIERHLGSYQQGQQNPQNPQDDGQNLDQS